MSTQQMRHLALLLFLPLALRNAPAAEPERPFAFGPVRFEENRGQAAPGVSFLARARAYHVLIEGNEVLLSPANGPAVRLSFDGASEPRWMAQGAPTSSISYYVGNDPSKWVKDAPSYDRIAWHDLYPGIDLILYGSGDRLEYDLVLAPNADPSRVRLRFSASGKPTLRPDGAIEAGGILQRAPHIYQQSPAGGHTAVSGRFKPAGDGLFTLELGKYDLSLPLTVDPVLEASSYFGGENDDEIIAIGDGYVAGNTRSVGLPNAVPVVRGSRDVFIRGTGQVVPGTGLSASTFSGTLVIGGSDDDELGAIAIQYAGNDAFVVAGTTRSRDFPSATNNYHGGSSDGFLFFVSERYQLIRDVMYLGGSGEDRIHAAAVDSWFFAVAGATDSPDLPVNGGFQRTFGGGKDAFYVFGRVANPAYWNSGILGGSGDDSARAVALRSNSLWIAGDTTSPDFPSTPDSLSGPSDAFLTRLTYKFVNSIPDVDIVEQESHLIGGSGNDSIRSLAAVPSSLGAPSPMPTLPAVVGFAGITSSADLPVKNAAQPAFGGETDGLAGAWDSKSGSVSWLTYLGGTAVDEAASIDQNWAGDFYIAGWTRSSDLFLANPLQPVNAGGEDALFAVYGIDGAPVHISYFGGSGDDRARAVRLLYNSVARIAGSSTSTDLPVNDATARPPAMNGFIADVGTDHLIGGAEIILPKDGTIKVSLRPGRTSYRPAVTWRSSDPSLVRFNYLGRPVDAVTTGDDAVAIEALGSGSEVTLTATADGYLPKSIRVKLYPGVFVPTRSTIPNSTWNSPFSLNAFYYAYDPETGATVANPVILRPGAASPVFKWVSSNPGVVALEASASGTKALILAPGEAELTLAVEGYKVLDSRKISVLKPQIVPDGPVRVGKDLQVPVPCYPKIGGYSSTFDQMRGTLTARSSDPSRLLLSTASNQPGRETVTIPFSNTMSLLAHGLTSEGQAEVLLSSPELESDARVSVILEPAVIRFGRAGYETGEAVVVPSFSLVAGNEPASADLWLGIASSPGRLYRRPGAPPLTVQFSNSDPSVVQQNYASINPAREGLRLKGLKPGTADLTLSASDQEIRILDPSVPVTVVPAQAIWQLPERIFLGRNLQTIVSFQIRVVDGAAISVESSDPAAVLVSSSELEPGSRQITIAPSNASSNNRSFWLQGLKSQGEARIRVVIAGVEERIIAVTLLPSGTGFTNLPTSNYGSVGVWAYDPVSGYGIAAQSPNPGVEVPARLRIEGPTLGVSQEPFVLTARAPSRQFTFSAPTRGSETTFFVESQDPYSPVPGDRKATLRGAGLSVGTSGSTTLLMTQDMLAKLQFQAYTGSEITLSSSDPQRLLVSASATEPGTASIRFGGGSVPGIYAQSLSDSGNATLRYESPGLPPYVVDVAFQPIRTSAANVTVAPSAETTVSAGVSYPLRPGALPIRIGLRTADPAIATVKPDSIQIPNTSASDITIAGVSEGVTQLLYDAPSGVFVTPQFGTIGVARTDPPVYLLGKNLQGALQLPLAGFPNPGGAILTISSSDPAKVLLSRSDLAPGSPSASIVVPAGQSITQPFYVQALESSGDVKLTASIDGRVTTLAIVRLGPAWVDCTSYGYALLDVKLNLTRSVGCYLRFDTSPYPPSPSLQSVHLRAGAGDATLRVSSSDPGIFTVQPDSLVFSPEKSSGSVTLKGVALGSADLQVIQPEGLGPGPAGVEALPVVVGAPAISARSAEVSISRDSLSPLPLTAEGSPAITATSEQPELLLVSKSPTALGVPSVTLAPSEPLYFHALGSQGTADVLLAAPGYESLRVGAALTRPTIGFTSTVSELRPGSSAMMAVGLIGAYDGQIRPGATFTVDLTSVPEGIVAIEPARGTIAPGQKTASFQIRALAAGSVLLRISAAPDVVVPGAPLTLNVRP